MKTKKDKDLDYEFNRIAGEVLRQKREKANLTLDQLGKRVRTTRQNIYKYEYNLSRIKVDMFISMCYALGEEPNIVFNEIKEKFDKTKL
jgi:predicted transcriptional regulator